MSEIFIRAIEKTINIWIVENAELLRLLGTEQHRFLKKDSTTSNILFHHRMIIKQLKPGKSVDCIYINLSSAFNEVTLLLLIKTWKKVGYHGRMLAF